MAKKDPKLVVEEVVNHLAVKPALVEYTRKEVPIPGQTGGGTIMVEYVHSDTKNPFELSVVSTPNQDTMARVRFPLTRELTDEQIESVAHDVLKLAGGIEGNLSVGAGNRVVLSYTLMRKDSDNAADASKTLDDTIARGTSYGQGLRNILDKSFGLPTDPGEEKWYQYKLGQPVKLSPAEMNQLQGGDTIDGLGTVLAAGIGAYFGVIGGVVVGLVAYTEEMAINHPEQFTPVVPSGPSGPYRPYTPYKTYCFTGGHRRDVGARLGSHRRPRRRRPHQRWQRRHHGARARAPRRPLRHGRDRHRTWLDRGDPRPPVLPCGSVGSRRRAADRRHHPGRACCRGGHRGVERADDERRVRRR